MDRRSRRNGHARGGADGHAATVSIAHRGEGYGQHWTLWVVAEPGKRNGIFVRYGAEGIRVTDSVPLSAGDYCARQVDAASFT